MKTKGFELQVKDLSEEGIFEGYGSVFGVRDSYNESVEPGAFVASLAKHRREGTMPLMLWQHDPWTPIGVWEELAEDGKGLWVKGLLLSGVQKSDEVRIMLKNKAIRGLSIGYREVDTKPAENGGPRKLVEVDLLEVSIVSFPANRRANVETVKSERMDEFARRLRDGDPMPIKDFEDILREAGVPKSMAVAIASHGYAKAIRSESEGEKANDQALRFLQMLKTD
ncbi:HK97 family phage prohead protease [Neorhizobium petrolearium]|uniref:HK97 family phage prohead protease n=1 Tax=Neorhizobium petrolearium TaxID=515361 RepID=A0ABY8M3X9_9HYPH|nr:HK97 family phage prohead protease [Neorhizobium petrolearium]MCC2608382.1 HK97 family phage prohead protease [Neorhizobium petrolearium]WGI68661.1 HK97 family phage prohead protease [Neorhizobium petrolearium]